MNKNIFLKDLASMLSQAAEIDVFTAETFVKCFSEVFEDALRSEGLLKIKGLGTFNIEQSGNKHRVVFLPERELAEAVNAPFKFFEPVVLSDDVTNEELDKYNELEDEDTEPLFGTDIYGDTSDDPEPEIELEPVSEPDPIEPEPIEHEIEPVSEPDPIEPEPIEPVVSNVSIVSNDPIDPEPEPIEPTPEPESIDPEPEPEPESIEPEPIEPEPKPIVSNVSVEPESTQPIDSTNSTETTETTNSTESNDSTVPAQTTVEQRLSQFSHGNNPYDTKWSDNDDYNEGKPWFWIAIAFVAGILMGGATGFLCHDSITGKTNTIIDYTKYYEQPTDTVVTPVDIIEIQDTLATAENTDTTQEPEAPVVAVERQPEAQALPQPEKFITDTVTPKNFLTLMAKKHYGRADYWVYIYLENESKIPDPNNVLSGTILVIPPRSKYDKSTDEAENLRNAKNIAREIANEQQLKRRK